MDAQLCVDSNRFSYPVQLRVRYEMKTGSEQPLRRGEGCTISISSTEVVFGAPDALPIGRPVRLCIDWPVKLNDRLNLRLDVRGKTVRAQSRRITVKIVCYEFRIRRVALAGTVTLSVMGHALFAGGRG